MIGWTLGKIAPNFANILRKLFQTRMVKTPRSAFFKSTPINKWPKDGPAIVTQKIPVSFTKQGRPFEQTYSWKSHLGGLKYKAPTLEKGGAKFLSNKSIVGPSIVKEKVKAVSKFSIAGTTGTALGYASTQRKPTKAGLAPPKVQKTSGWGTGERFGRAVKRSVSAPVTKTKTPDRFSSGSYRAPSKSGLQTIVKTRPNITQSVKNLATTVKTRPSIASYKAAPKAKVSVAKVAKTTTKVSAPVRKLASTSRAKGTVETTAASRKAAAAGILTAKIIRKFGITPDQVRASDKSEKARLLGSGTIKGPKKTTSIKSPFAGDIVKQQASGYHIFRKGSKGALSFRKAYAAAKGKKFKWIGTGKWYSGA